MSGPCAKRRVICAILSSDGEEFRGENDCANPQETCPRLPGEGYEKCQSICQQGDHAEIKALRLAGDKAQGATVGLFGHYYICEPCGRALRDAKVRFLSIEYGMA